MHDFPVSMAKQRAVNELLCTLRSGLTSDEDEEGDDDMCDGKEAAGIGAQRPACGAGFGHVFPGGSDTGADRSSGADHADAMPPLEPPNLFVARQVSRGQPPVAFEDYNGDGSSGGEFGGGDPSLPLPSPWRPAAAPAGGPLLHQSTAVGRRDTIPPLIGSDGGDTAQREPPSPASDAAVRSGATASELGCTKVLAAPVGPAAAAALALAARIRTRLAACLGEQLEEARLLRRATALSADKARSVAAAAGTSRLEVDAAAVASKKRSQSGRDAEARAAQLAKKAAAAASTASRLAAAFVDEAAVARREAAAATAAATAATEDAAAARRAVKQAAVRVRALEDELAELADAGGDAPLQQVGSLVHSMACPPAAGHLHPSLVRVVPRRRDVSACAPNSFPSPPQTCAADSQPYDIERRSPLRGERCAGALLRHGTHIRWSLCSAAGASGGWTRARACAAANDVQRRRISACRR